MSENRIPREMQSRSKSERPKVAWSPADLLPEVIQEEGYAYRWIRASSLDKSDPSNLQAKLREGWEPVKVAEQPHLKLLADKDSPIEGAIQIGGLLLCKAPIEMVEQRNAYYQRSAQQQMEAVDNNLMRENDARMPLFRENHQKVVFGRGRTN